MKSKDITQLREAYEELRNKPFPRVLGSAQVSDQLKDAQSELAMVDGYVAGCVSQLLDSRKRMRGIAVCRRVLVVNEELTRKIRSAPEADDDLFKSELMAYKLVLDELILIAQLLLESVSRGRPPRRA